MQLIVSLPRNETALALAAAAEGADGIKLHMNVEHRASGTVFGSYADEQARIREIIGLVKCEVGLMPGTDSALPSAEELIALHKAGLAFVDIYAQHMPLWMLELPLRVIAAIDHEHVSLFLNGCIQPNELMPTGLDMLEASFTQPGDYGRALNYLDLLKLAALQEAVEMPILVPTQKAITPEDAMQLARMEIGGLMIGAVVTGDSPESIARATAAYRKAIDRTS